METITANLTKLKMPTESDRIFKDECVYSFDTPDSKDGLFVCCSTFLGFGIDYVEKYFLKTRNGIFLHIKRTRKEIENEASDNNPKKKLTRLAIGIEGGFENEEKTYEYETFYKIYVLPDNIYISYPSEDLPQAMIRIVDGIINSESAGVRNLKESLAGTWDGELRKVSVYAENLEQLQNGIKIPPTGWKCQNCDLTSNLWLNLTDGSILCGRKFFDGTGGNNHAVDHYHQTKYPLAVKLGTITADGKGDVYSYPEDDMVEDPYLQKHLFHFGINVGLLQKTEKSMVEMEIELNQKVGEWGLLTESTNQLQPIFGPGYTGMKNLGNSCYLNSVMQVLFTVPDFIERFVTNADEYFSKFPSDPSQDFNIQMSKLGTGLWSGKYSATPENIENGEVVGISPHTFKSLVGRGHQDFSTNTQQDAQEYFLHLLNVLQKNSKNQFNPGNALKFKVEDCVRCGSSGKVKYTYRDEWSLSLIIPLDKTRNQDEVVEFEKKREEAEKNGIKLNPDDIVRPIIPLEACLQQFAADEIVEQFYSSAINDSTTATKTSRLASMPDYLMIQLKKFTIKEDWTEVKLNVAIDVPDILDLSQLRGKGIQPGEEELPELSSVPSKVMEFDPDVLQNLVDMGFPVEACKKAIYFTKNSGLEPATGWIMEHMGDSDFGDPLVLPGLTLSKPVKFVPNEEGLMLLTSMGFTKEQAVRALESTDNNAERAVDYIFSHPEEINTNSESQIEENVYRDGSSKYKLVAFISHMGMTSLVGHYVCHILKDQQWIIYNDEKVAISQNPPKELAYLYLYERVKE